MRSDATLLTALLAARADGRLVTRQETPCSDVHIFLGKGNNEPYPGRQGVLVEAICSGLESCDYEDILFYNPVESPYCDSVTEGQANGVAQITAYSERCPDSKLVVSGYSQGAHVVADVLGGGGGVFFQDCVQPPGDHLDATEGPGSHIVAALVFGSTRHTANQPWNVQSGAGGNGLFPRNSQQLANLAAYGDRLRDYCVESDPICAGGDNVENHLNYFDIYTNEAAEWVQEMVAEAGDAPATSSSTTRAPASTSTETSAEPTSTTSEAAEETTESSEAETSTSAVPSTTSEETTTAESTTASTEPSSTEASSTETVSTASAGTESDSSAPTSTEPSSTSPAESETGVPDPEESDPAENAALSIRPSGVVFLALSLLGAFLAI